MKKLRENCGETLVETLVSILFVALSGTMLLTATLAANKVNRAAVKLDEDLRTGQEAAERQAAETEIGQVTITTEYGSVTYDVSVFSSGDGTDSKLKTYILK